MLTQPLNDVDISVHVIKHSSRRPQTLHLSAIWQPGWMVA